MRPGTRRSLLASLIASPLLRRPALAALPPPAGEVVLRVTGAITHANVDGAAEFDLPLLESLGIERLRTWTPWTEGEPLFDGVLARTLMQAVGAHGTQVQARARNDYLAVIPLEDFARWPVLLATHMDSQRLRLRDKGPIWIIYPWSDDPELNNRLIRQRSVWQLASLLVE